MTLTEQMVLAQNLKALKLSTMVGNLDSHLRQARENSMDYDEFLLGLTEIELQVRSDNRFKRRMREAKFPLLKTFETFDFDATPDLDRRFIHELATGEYIREYRNISFLGKSGTGKTHLATSLAVEACKQGVRTRFVSCCGLANELIEARHERELSRVIQRYARYGLLVLDELGYVPLAKEGADLLFQVFAERHEKGSVIVTTNLGFADWTQIFGDANLTAALLDRLTHKAHILNCNWESYRLKDTLKQTKRTKK